MLIKFQVFVEPVDSICESLIRYNMLIVAINVIQYTVVITLINLNMGIKTK